MLPSLYSAASCSPQRQEKSGIEGNRAHLGELSTDPTKLNRHLAEASGHLIERRSRLAEQSPHLTKLRPRLAIRGSLFSSALEIW